MRDFKERAILSVGFLSCSPRQWLKSTPAAIFPLFKVTNSQDFFATCVSSSSVSKCNGEIMVFLQTWRWNCASPRCWKAIVLLEVGAEDRPEYFEVYRWSRWSFQIQKQSQAFHRSTKLNKTVPITDPGGKPLTRTWQTSTYSTKTCWLSEGPRALLLEAVLEPKLQPALHPLCPRLKAQYLFFHSLLILLKRHAAIDWSCSILGLLWWNRCILS